MPEVTILQIGQNDLQKMLDAAIEKAVMAAAKKTGETFGVRRSSFGPPVHQPPLPTSGAPVSADPFQRPPGQHLRICAFFQSIRTRAGFT